MKKPMTSMIGHAEAVEIVYDPSRITYAEPLDVFWRNIDPTQINGQFVDTGRQYRTAIFYHDEDQRGLAVASKKELENSGRHDKKIVTEIVPATEFYKAEEYHRTITKKVRSYISFTDMDPAEISS